MERVDVAIIGGGISGLTAGFELVSNGLSVKVFEGGEVGGLIQTDRVESRCGGSFLLEKGPNLFVAKPALVELLARLKLNNEIVRSVVPNYRQYIWDGIRPVAVAKDPIALIGSPLASLPEKIRLLYSLFSGCATNDSGEVDGEDLLSRSKNSHSSEDSS
jgi:protoporphyrinogen oxidase